MNQEKFWVLFSKNLSGEATADEQAELTQLIEKHPEWKDALQNAENIWNAKSKPVLENLSAEDAYILHLHRMSDMNIELEVDRTADIHSLEKKKSLSGRWYWAAASLFLIIISSLYFSGVFSYGKKEEVALAEKNEVSTRLGSKSTVKLPDGSVVMLNAGSRLTYNKDFGKEKREVTLSGEGYFDVVKMTDKPFIINTEAINIKVLGTAFNVKAYPEDKQTVTSLIRGSVEITIRNRPKDKIILSPNEKLVVDNDAVLAEETEKERKISKPSRTAKTMVSIDKIQLLPADNSVAEIQWTKNKLVFRGEPLADILVEMERWYGTKIELKNSLISAKAINVTFERETIYEALDALKESIKFNYEIANNRIIIN